MRSRRLRFALFAVIPVAASVFLTPPPAHAASATETKLLWPLENGPPSGGDAVFYVTVGIKEGSGRPPVCAQGTADKDCPAATLVKVGVDTTSASAAQTWPLRGDDPRIPTASVTANHTLPLGTVPHYLTARYAASTDFGASGDDLGLATGELSANPEPGREGEPVTFGFTLSINDRATPPDHRPIGTVAFSDDDGQSASRDLHDSDLSASWTIAQRGARRVVTANFGPDDTKIWLPVSITRAHNLDPAPGSTTSKTTTTRRPTATTNRSGTTVALAPINPGASTSTSLGETSTEPTFGAFPTTPRSGSEVAASPKKNEGPPIAVVVTTLLALGVLGGIAAFRRYRRSAIDWF